MLITLIVTNNILGSASQIWPTDLHANSLQNYDCLSDNAKIFDPACPSAGYPAVYQHFSNWWSYPDDSRIIFETQDYDIRKSIYGFVHKRQIWDRERHPVEHVGWDPVIENRFEQSDCAARFGYIENLLDSMPAEEVLDSLDDEYSN